MIRTLFLNKQALEKGAVRPALPDESVKKLGVLGAGMMGAGIATVAAQAGIDVVLLDRDQEAADRGKAHAAGYFDDGVKRKKTTPEKRDAALARITATPDYAALAGCDLVIEAVFEDPAVKAEATRERRGPPRPGGDLRHQHLDPADRRPRQGEPRPGELPRHPLLLAGREDGRSSRSSAAPRPPTAPSPRRSTSSARSGRPRSSSTTPASSTPTAASSPTSTRACAWSPRASSPR